MISDMKKMNPIFIYYLFFQGMIKNRFSLCLLVAFIPKNIPINIGIYYIQNSVNKLSQIF